MSRPPSISRRGGGAGMKSSPRSRRTMRASVTVLEAARVLAKDDPELAELLIQRLIADGVAIEAGVKIRRVERAGARIAAVLEDGAGERRVEGSHLLVAAGRRANLAGLDLDKAGIRTDERGGLIVVPRLPTTHPPRFAAAVPPDDAQFTTNPA